MNFNPQKNIEWYTITKIMVNDFSVFIMGYYEINHFCLANSANSGAIYSKEVEPLLRELMPVEEVFLPSNALRRGPNGPNPFYGLGIHQDFGLYPEDMETSFISSEDSFWAILDSYQAHVDPCLQFLPWDDFSSCNWLVKHIT